MTSSTSTSATIAALTYDQRFYAVLGLSVSLIVLAALWIVAILVAIEANKAAFYSMPENSLEMQEDDTTDGLEHEKATATSPPTSPKTSKTTPRRRVRWSFKFMQLASVSVLLLLTYLLLVVTEAPMWASALGSLCVFGIFLRFQIGDELRRQRLDRIMLMMSLFLMIASLMSVCTYAFKSLGNGEIYEGPARIIGYNPEPYNNTDHDPTTRMDLAVQWGRAWGCPLSGGKLCQANVQGAMCTVNLDPSNRRRAQEQRQKRILADDEEEVDEQEEGTAVDQTQDEGVTEEVLEEENSELEAENEKLEKEVEELELANEETEEVAEEEVEAVEEEEAENAAIYDEDIEVVEEEELMVEEEYTDAYIEVEEEKVEVEEEYVGDGSDEMAQDEETIAELEDEKVEIDEAYEEYEDEYAENAQDFEESAEEAEVVEEEIVEGEEETKAEYSEAIEDVAEGATTEGQDEAIQEAAEETVDTAMEGGEMEEEEDMDWYWDELTYEYDDDYYETEYWSDYDWDSVWGEYACEDMFDEDAADLNYDASIEAGKDGYPYVNIYGSCKTCEAYILDYFAEEAFESVEEHKKMAVLYMTGAIFGFFLSFLSFIKYKVRPAAENEIELLDTDSGVMA